MGKQPIRTNHSLIKWNSESCDFRGSLGKRGQDKDWMSTMHKEVIHFENHRRIEEPAGSLKFHCFDKLRTLWLTDFMKMWRQGNTILISWVVLYLCSYFYCHEVRKIQGNRSKLFMLSQIYFPKVENACSQHFLHKCISKCQGYQIQIIQLCPLGHGWQWLRLFLIVTKWERGMFLASAR